MKSHHHRTLMLGLALSAQLSALSFFCSCSRRETVVEAGLRTQTLHVVYGAGAEPSGLDPQTGEDDATIIRALMEGLVDADPHDCHPVPALAESWESSPDGLGWTFHLRADARWSNGDPVTAQDFVYAYRRILSPKLAKTVLHVASAATSFVAPGCGGYTSDSSILNFDLAEARRLLAAAGFPDGRGFPRLELLFPTGIAYLQHLPEAIQEMWRKHLGIDVALLNQEQEVAQDAIDHKRYDLALGIWGADYLDPTTFLELFLADGANNKTGWASAGYDRLYAQAATTLDQSRRFELLRQAESLMLADAAILPICFFPGRALRHPAVKGWADNPLQLQQLKLVYLEK